MELMEQLTTAEINKLAEMVADKTSQSDWEYQDDDYRLFVESMLAKLNRMYIQGLNK